MTAGTPPALSARLITISDAEQCSCLPMKRAVDPVEQLLLTL
jgi:hypothetical protein